jgi:hypothetical protein
MWQSILLAAAIASITFPQEAPKSPPKATRPKVAVDDVAKARSRLQRAKSDADLLRAKSDEFYKLYKMDKVTREQAMKVDLAARQAATRRDVAEEEVLFLEYRLKKQTSKPETAPAPRPVK